MIRSVPLPFLLGLLLGMASLAPTAHAAGKKPAKTPAADPAPPVAAAVRIWKGDVSGGRSLRITFKSARKPLPAPVETGSSYFFSPYFAVPPDDLQLEIVDVAKPEVRLLTVPARLAAKERATLIIAETDGELKADLLRHVALPKATAEVQIHNFVPSLAEMRVKIGEDVQLRLTSGESFADIRGLAPHVLLIETSGTFGDGKKFEWSNSLDLTAGVRAHVLIFPDPYGRVRPRIVLDGAKTPAEEPAPAPE